MAQTLKEKTPREDGFRMPGEFEPHAGCWMLWPERGDNWRLGAKPAQRCFVAIATAIARWLECGLLLLIIYRRRLPLAA